MTAVLIPHSIFDALRVHVNSRKDGHEQGGLFLGFRKPGALQIDEVTFPNRWDRASVAQFMRSERGHRVRALRAWVRSGRTMDWIGEWHTHPGGMATPSFIDRRSWLRLAKHTGKPMLFMVLSDAQVFLGVQRPETDRVLALKLVEENAEASLFE